MIDDLENIFISPPEIKFIGTNNRNCGREFYPGTELWAMILFDYYADIEINQEPIETVPGYIAILSPYTSRSFNFVSNVKHRTVHFSLRNCNEKESFTLINAHKNFKELLTKFDKMFDLYLTTPLRAKAILWDLLLEVVGTNSTERKKADHPALKKAVAFIERNIDKKIEVSKLSLHSGISQTHLNLLFNKKFGTSTERYILNRKMETAEFLMSHSGMPIKEIAYATGYPDLQHFNKRVRSYFGKNPRQLREKSSS